MRIFQNEIGDSICEHGTPVNLLLSTVCYNKNCLKCTEHELRKTEEKLLPAYKRKPKAVNHEWVRQLIDACTSGNSHGNHVGNQVLCHRVAFQLNKHFGLETRDWNTDGDPERDPDFKDPYPSTDYFNEVAESVKRKVGYGG